MIFSGQVRGRSVMHRRMTSGYTISVLLPLLIAAMRSCVESTTPWAFHLPSILLGSVANDKGNEKQNHRKTYSIWTRTMG